MIAWLALAVMICAALGLLRWMAVRGGLLTAAAAAMLFGAAGYAIQGYPDLPSAAPQARPADHSIPLTDARHAFFGNFSAGESWLRMSEAFARNGNDRDAVGILANAVEKYPGDAQLWVGLGNALVDQSGTITPPAELAYQRAIEVAPGNPAGRFFQGLAEARSGDPARAVAEWKQILAQAPANASWRPLIEQGVAALDPAARRQLQAQAQVGAQRQAAAGS